MHYLLQLIYLKIIENVLKELMARIVLFLRNYVFNPQSIVPMGSRLNSFIDPCLGVHNPKLIPGVHIKGKCTTALRGPYTPRTILSLDIYMYINHAYKVYISKVNAQQP